MTALIKRNAKAIVAFITAAVTAWLARHGVKLDPTVEIAGAAFLTGLLVWLVRNSG